MMKKRVDGKKTTEIVMSEYSRTGVYGMQIWNVEKAKETGCC
jgi:hypothetical protein